MNEFLKNLPALVDDIKALRDTIITNIVLVGQVPAPTFKEKRRSSLFQERLAEFGVDEVTTDGYRNPIGIIRGTSPEKPPIFIVAHLDTFFERDIVHNYTIRKNTITGPGILDNSLGVGVLASLPIIFERLGLRFESDVVLAGDGIFSDGIVMNDVFFKKCIQVGYNENRRFLRRGSSDDANWITITVGGHFIDPEFGQTFLEKTTASFFFECRCRNLAD